MNHPINNIPFEIRNWINRLYFRFTYRAHAYTHTRTHKLASNVTLDSHLDRDEFFSAEDAQLEYISRSLSTGSPFRLRNTTYTSNAERHECTVHYIQCEFPRSLVLDHTSILRLLYTSAVAWSINSDYSVCCHSAFGSVHLIGCFFPFRRAFSILHHKKTKKSSK